MIAFSISAPLASFRRDRSANHVEQCYGTIPFSAAVGLVCNLAGFDTGDRGAAASEAQEDITVRIAVAPLTGTHAGALLQHRHTQTKLKPTRQPGSIVPKTREYLSGFSAAIAVDCSVLEPRIRETLAGSCSWPTHGHLVAGATECPISHVSDGVGSVPWLVRFDPYNYLDGALFRLSTGDCMAGSPVEKLFVAGPSTDWPAEWLRSDVIGHWL